jgi:hypothetical protein
MPEIDDAPQLARRWDKATKAASKNAAEAEVMSKVQIKQTVQPSQTYQTHLVEPTSVECLKRKRC